MGYRSDVGLCLTKTGVEKLHTRLAALEPKEKKTQDITSLLTSYCDRHEENESGARVWFWGNVKWYWDYHDVDFVEDVIRGLDDEDYYFIRVGEQNDDTEVRGGFFDNPFCMSLVRCIAFD